MPNIDLPAVPPAVTEATRHGIYPEMDHDERARLNFLACAYKTLATQIAPGNQRAYDTVVLPQFRKEHSRPPKDRHEVRRAMNQNGFHSMWGGIRRNLMEIRQFTGREIVLRQLDTLAERAERLNQNSDRLKLDPSVRIPNYVGKVDHHCMPGSYYTELVDGDVSPAANYDSGFFVTTGGTIGGLCDGAGKAIAQWAKTCRDGFKPKRILDIGVALGHSAVPIAQMFPDAEIIALDVAAPMLRYGHARATSLGVDNITFIQANGEDLSAYADGEFDWVMTSIFLHELSGSALPRIIKEAYRVLAPGGLMLHLEQPQYTDDMPIYEQFIRDWDAFNNNEPFWSAMHETDLTALLGETGFPRDNIFMTSIKGAVDEKLFPVVDLSKNEDHGRSAAWHAYGAWKA